MFIYIHIKLVHRLHFCTDYVKRNGNTDREATLSETFLLSLLKRKKEFASQISLENDFNDSKKITKQRDEFLFSLFFQKHIKMDKKKKTRPRMVN